VSERARASERASERQSLFGEKIGEILAYGNLSCELVAPAQHICFLFCFQSCTHRQDISQPPPPPSPPPLPSPPFPSPSPYCAVCCECKVAVTISNISQDCAHIYVYTYMYVYIWVHISQDCAHSEWRKSSQGPRTACASATTFSCRSSGTVARRDRVRGWSSSCLARAGVARSRPASTSFIALCFEHTSSSSSSSFPLNFASMTRLNIANKYCEDEEHKDFAQRRQ